MPAPINADFQGTCRLGRIWYSTANSSVVIRGGSSPAAAFSRVACTALLNQWPL